MDAHFADDIVLLLFIFVFGIVFGLILFSGGGVS